MDWLLLTTLSIICRSIYGVMTKVLSDKAVGSVYTQATILPLAGALVAILIAPLLGGFTFDFSKLSLVAVALVVLGQGLGNITYFAAIKKLTNGTAQIAFSSILIFNTVLAIVFLGLHLSFMNIFGVLLLALAILSVVNGKVEFNKQGAGLMVLSAFLFSVFQLASAELSQQVSAATYLVIAYLGAALVVFVLKSRVIINDLKKGSMRSTIQLPLLTALPSVGNFLFAYYAYSVAQEPAKVAMLLTAQVVLTVLLSYVFLKERSHTWQKVGAAILVVIAAILIKS